MAYRLTWLYDALKDAGLKVAAVPGWEERGHGNMEAPAGVIVHHTGGPLTGNMPSLGVVTNGRPGLSGPLAQLGLGRDGTFYCIAAGRAFHAGPGIWGGVTTGNSSFIGIEAENSGTAQDCWPDIQLDALRRGIAAILARIGANVAMCCGHREYALPSGRKVDPLFDMDAFRREIAAHMAAPTPRAPIPACDAGQQPTLRRGACGPWVVHLQTMLKETADGQFGGHTEAAVRVAQRAAGLVPDGIVGPKTWAALAAA